ncbi:MAG TPA: hypothetical protein VFL41_00395 [Gaiellaceae bacterium]|nr:hypothetical protein [Gaiellaceae bacterium]
MRDVPLGTLIFRAGLLGEQQLEEAHQEGMRTGKRLGEVLLERGWLHERDLGRLLAGQKGLPFVELSGVMPDATAVPLIPEETARLQNALAIAFEKGVPVVAVADPANELVLENLRRVLGCQPRLLVAAYGDLRRKIDEAYASAQGFGPADQARVAPEAPAAVVPPSEPVVAPEPDPTPGPEPAPLVALPPAAEPAPLAAEPDVRAAEAPAPEGPAMYAPAPPPQEPTAQPAPLPEPEPESAATVTVESPRAEDSPPAAEQVVASEPHPTPEPAPLVAFPPAAEPASAAAEPTVPAAEAPAPEAPPMLAQPAQAPAEQPAPLPEPEPAAPAEPPVAPVDAQPLAAEPAPEAPFLPAPEPRDEPEPAPTAAEPELSVPGAGAEVSPHHVVLRLTDGEQLEIGSFGSADDAQGFAHEVVRQIAAAEGEATWPFFASRFLRPATIVSVDVIAPAE